MVGAPTYRVPVSRSTRPLLPVVLLAGGVALAGCGSSAATGSAGGHEGHGPPATVEGPDDRYAGIDLPEPYQRPSFTLTDTSGGSFDFAAETGGKPTLLFFGYTQCPDVCPATMADVAVALRKTDPATDTPEVLGEYLDRFDADLPTQFIGLTGKQDVIDQAQLSAGVPLAEEDGRQHSSLLLLYTADDEAPVAFDTGNTPEDIAGDLALVTGS